MYFFWTDGSSSLKTGMCGWSAICFVDLANINKKTQTDNSERIVICGFEKGTNQRAELLAIYHALMHTPPKAKICIKTDSEYAINCITKYRKDWEASDFITSGGTPVKNLEILKNIWELFDRRHVYLEYVRGHNGHAGNEIADYVAGLARRTGEGQFDKNIAEILIREKISVDSICFK